MNSSLGDFSPAFGRVSPEGFGQPLCLMSPIGRKASVEGGISPSDLAHSPPSPQRSSHRLAVSSAPTTVFARTAHSPRYSLASSASAYGGSQFLLNDAPHCSSPQRVFSSLQLWGYLRKINLARLLQPRKLSFRYGGSLILLDNPVPPIFFSGQPVLPASLLYQPFFVLYQLESTSEYP